MDQYAPASLEFGSDFRRRIPGSGINPHANRTALNWNLMLPPIPRKPDGDATGRTHLASPRNIRPLLGTLWDTSPSLAFVSRAPRLAGVVARIKRGNGNVSGLSSLVVLDLGLAVLSDLPARANSLADSLLGDRFTNRISVRLIGHATQLHLASFGDPVFCDKLERAAVLNVAQDTLSMISFFAGLIVFSPWLVVLLVAAVIPAFLGETHFPALAYSVLSRWMPQRRLLDYILLVGASNLFEFFEMSPAITSTTRALPTPRTIRTGFYVWNCVYPVSSHIVFGNNNFCLETQEKLSLIGESRAGKTTFVKLLAPPRDPASARPSGTASISGNPISKRHYEELFKLQAAGYR